MYVIYIHMNSRCLPHLVHDQVAPAHGAAEHGAPVRGADGVVGGHGYIKAGGVGEHLLRGAFKSHSRVEQWSGYPVR